MKYTYLKTLSFILLAFGVFTLSGCDGTTGIPSDNQIVGTAVGSPPVAVAVVTPEFIAIGQTASVTLDGSGSSDPDDDIETYEWYLSSATLAGVHIGSGIELILTDADLNTLNLAQGEYIVTLIVTDSEGNTDRVEVIITVGYFA